MSKQHTTNIAASLHARLVNKARASGLDVNIFRMRYAIERFLYRLSLSKYCNKFTLKGAMHYNQKSMQIRKIKEDQDYEGLRVTLAAPMLYVYSRETVIAEKLEAMVKLDLANSRMKDFYDIWVITQKLGFDKHLLKQAIYATFKRRKTTFPEKGILSLTPYFYDDSKKNIQWNAFLKKGSVRHNELMLSRVCEDIKKVLKKSLTI